MAMSFRKGSMQRNPLNFRTTPSSFSRRLSFLRVQKWTSCDVSVIYFLYIKSVMISTLSYLFNSRSWLAYLLLMWCYRNMPHIKVRIHKNYRNNQATKDTQPPQRQSIYPNNIPNDTKNSLKDQNIRPTPRKKHKRRENKRQWIKQ